MTLQLDLFSSPIVTGGGFRSPVQSALPAQRAAPRPNRQGEEQQERKARFSLLLALQEAEDVSLTYSDVDSMLNRAGRPDPALIEAWEHYEAVIAGNAPDFDLHCRFSLAVSGLAYQVDYFPPKIGFGVDSFAGGRYALTFRGPKDGPLTNTGYYGPLFLGGRPDFPSPVEFAANEAEKHIQEYGPKPPKKQKSKGLL